MNDNIYIYIYIYIVIHRQTFSLCHNFLDWLDMQDVKSARYLTTDPSSFSVLLKEFFRITFCIYVIGYWERSIHAKCYCISAFVVAGKFAS